MSSWFVLGEYLTLSVAIALNAGAALTYSARVLEAVDSVSQQ